MNGINFCRLTLISVLLGITLIPQEAQAYDSYDPAPEPETPDPEGGNNNLGIEGINEIIGTTGGLINLSQEYTVDGADGLPNPDHVIGEGNLLHVVESAGNVWETAFPGLTDNVNLKVGWADFGADLEQILANPILEEAVNSSGLETDGIFSFYIHGGNLFPNISAEDEGVINVDPQIPPVPIVPILSSLESSEELAPSAEPDDKIDGLILFNSRPLKGDLDGDGEEERILLYLDKNPLNSIVFGSLEEVASDDRSIDGINYGRSTFKKPEDFPQANEDDLVIDAFSVALHELQHNLGLSRGNPAATSILMNDNNTNSNGPLSDLKIDIGSYNTIIPTTFDKNEDPEDRSLHLFDDLNGQAGGNTPDTDIIFTQQISTPIGLKFATNSERKCPSEADVLAIAQINGFENPVLNPCKALARSVPEPSATIPLIMFGFGGLWIGRKRLYSSMSS